MSNYDVETRGGRAAKTTLLGILALAIFNCHISWFTLHWDTLYQHR